MIHWEAELNCFTTVVWNVMIDHLRKSNRAVSFRESPTKLLSRWYMTPSKIHSFYPETSPNCFRWCSELGSFLHIFWSCEHLKPIWRAAITRIEESSKQKIPLSPQACLLYATVPNIPTPCNRLLHSLTSSIQWMIAFNWRTHNLSWSQVLSRMEMLRLSEMIHHTLYDSMHIFNNKWNYWILP